MALSECTNQCHSQQHADDVIAMVTSSAPEEQWSGLYGYGRTALHVAASCGRAGLLEWLVKEEKADLQSKDQESGWTSLHRSIFYGQLVSAVKLIQLGASLKSCDFEDLTPLEVAVKDKPPHIDFSVDNPCDVYTWGSNSNFTLGHSNQQSRLSPDVVDEFLRVKVHIKQVVMNKYHTVVLAVNGRVFTCGHGQGGRLGQGKEETCLLPKMVKGLNGVCVFIAAARDQTLFQMEDGSIYGCGQNKFGQLGISPKEDKYLKPRQILGKGFANKDNVCMVAAKFHSVFFSSQEVFTCGLNAGQIGHAKSNQFISVPKLVTTLNHKNMEICHIAASDGVTACSTSNGDIYLLQNFVCRKIVNKQLNIAKIVVCGGTLDTGLEEIEVQGKSKAPVVMVILHKSGKVLSWQSSDETLRRCVINRKRQIFFTDLTLSKQGLLLATTEGEAFKGHFTQKKTAPVFVSGTSRQGFIQIGGVEQVDKEKRELINIQHVPCLHRVAKVTCDPQGHNFAVLQNDPRMGLTEIPEVGPCSMETNLKMLLSEVSCADSIHDIEIKTSEISRLVYKYNPAHKFILASRSDYFKRQLMGDSQSNEEDVMTLEEEVHLNRNVTTIDMTTAVNSDILNRILTYLYTNSCDVFDWNFVENVLKQRESQVWHETADHQREPNSKE
ncbi:putative inhibitor of Bruton tyrosine kinase-like [Apostichopus japonicus]|uniref:Putative inhibitor of Bruton tyrosine kinase-like n=1 Tax=Stichopus japonicus TaxID=307972 RepID=A0A2G8JEU8_STIJA|nr:putative inhibitor of Bruton tyrosine kinase-like [Apostichopus japonicus]